jgi:GTPase SAR1 family protein
MCWDTSGQARFEQVVSMFLKNSQVAVIVYDLQEPSSFDTAVKWHRRVQSYCTLNSSTIHTYLVGNKMDVESPMAPERVETYCQEHHLEHYKMESSDTAAVQRFLRYIVDCNGGPPVSNSDCCTIT